MFRTELHADISKHAARGVCKALPTRARRHKNYEMYTHSVVRGVLAILFSGVQQAIIAQPVSHKKAKQQCLESTKQVETVLRCVGETGK